MKIFMVRLVNVKDREKIMRGYRGPVSNSVLLEVHAVNKAEAFTRANCYGLCENLAIIWINEVRK